MSADVQGARVITPDRWRQITEIFHVALTRQTADRDSFLDEACAGDMALRRDVESLLQGHDDAASFGDLPLTVREARLVEGVRLGAYRVERLIDAGGMGEVYRATDTKLGREVALKVLPAVVASHPDRLARFTREAKLLASLNHPHIAAIYGVEDTGDVHAIVLELVEGQTLAGSLSGSKLSIVEVLRVAGQIADALAFAHARGIVHRDLKPANVMLTPSGSVKVLDFGLAKAGASVLPQPPASRSPSETGDGVIVGTPAYMSPEQARGKPVDKQTDIWAFGCVLYEMLANARAFSGETSSDTISAVLEREPDWSLIPASVPASIKTLLKRCLRKDPAERLHDMADAKLEIADALSSRPESAGTAPSRRGWIVAGVVVSVVALALVGLLLPKRETPAASSGLLELTINLPDVWPGYGFEISPDGRRIAMGVLSHGRPRIWLQALDGSDSKSVATPDFGIAPFWSPDGQSLAYISGGKLWRLGLASEAVTAVCDAPGRGSAGSWNQQGQIIFSARGALYRVPASGGVPQAVDVADPSSGRGSRFSPQFLPDSRHFIYHVRSATETAMYLGSLDNPRVTHLVDTPFAAKYVAPGYLLFIRGTALMAQRFDPSALSLSGEASIVAQDAAPGYQTTMLQFSASPDGVLAYIPTRAGTQGQLTWFDRNGHLVGHIPAPPRVEYLNPAISPAGDRIAVNRMDPETGNLDVWTIAVSNNLLTRQTNDPATDTDPVWAPDGQSFVFMSYRNKAQSFYRKSLDSTVEERIVTFDASVLNVHPTDWTRDGRFIVYELMNQQRRELEIWALPLTGGQPIPLAREGSSNYGGHVSPDGQWLAYSSYEDGAFAVYVQRFHGGGARTRVTPDGGVHPRWTDEGKTIVYSAEPDGVSAVDLTFSPAGVRGSAPRSIITEPIAVLLDGRSHYDMSRDGQRFLLRQSAGLARPIVKVLVNWTAKLKGGSR